MIRGYEEQFEGDTVIKIRSLLERIDSLKLPHRVSKYYIVDLSLCLKAGALLGALQLSASLLEIAVREMVVRLSHEGLLEGDYKRNLQKELEENRGLGFKDLISKLETVGFFNSKDAEIAKQFYNDIRIPIHHGLLSRFVSKQDDWLLSLKELFGGPFPISTREFESVIEEKALSLIEMAIGIIERNQK